MKNKLIKDFNLPNFTKKADTFSGASKLIEKKFEGRNDKASMQTKKEMLDRLAKAQEHVREIKGLNENTNEKALGSFAMMAAQPLINAAMKPLTGLLDKGINSLLGTDKKEEAEAKANLAQASMLNNQQFRNDFDGGGLAEIFKIVNPKFNTPGPTMANPEMSTRELEALIASSAPQEGFDLKSLLSQAGRLAPVASNLMQASNLRPAQTPRGNRAGKSYHAQPFDINLLRNAIDSAYNTQGAAAEMSGGDLSKAATMSRGLNLDKLRALTQGLTQADATNRQDRQLEGQLDQRRGLFSSQLDERFLDRRARDIGAYQTAKSGFLSQMANDVGAIGKEELQKELMKQMFGYDWRGRFQKDNAYGGLKLNCYGGKMKKK
jgi:hypothetical protein